MGWPYFSSQSELIRLTTLLKIWLVRCGILDLGQNQKPHVVGQEFEIVLSYLGIPADKVITRSTLLGCRTKENAGEWIMPSVKNQILQVLSDSVTETKDNGTGRATPGQGDITNFERRV